MHFRSSFPALFKRLATLSRLAALILSILLFAACAGVVREASAEVQTNIDDQTRNTDPEKTLKTMFWGKLYENGGETLFCKVKFSKKTVLIREAYYYDTDWMREALNCGTSSKCRTNSPEYRRMISDMHNIFPATMSFSLDRQSARFVEIGENGTEDECGVRSTYGEIEPPDEIKGRVARALLYMVDSYELPVPVRLDVLIDWSKRFPPDDQEIELNAAVAKLQGNRNAFIDDPKKAETLH